MAFKKKPYKWTLVKPGDIISFRYKSFAGAPQSMTRIHTVLVLNPRFIGKSKNGTQFRHLIGIKLKQNQKLEFRINQKQLNFFEKVGDFVMIDEKNNLYKLVFDESMVLNDIKGTKQRAWQFLEKSMDLVEGYRTYDWKKARASTVFLEPIRIFTDMKNQPKKEEFDLDDKGQKIKNKKNIKGKDEDKL